MLATAMAGFMAGAGAQELRDQARNAAIGDGVSTAVGLAVGAAELNPIGPLLTVGMKAVVFQYIETLPEIDQPRAYARATAMWSGAVANNVCITAAVLTGGGFAPVCIGVGVAWGMKTWHDTEPQRQFWEGCAMLRTYAEQPDLECVYRPEDLRRAAAESVVTAQVLEAP